MKNEPNRVGARKARKSKSNLDPDLKGIRLKGARHLNILSTARHAGLASSVSSEGKLRLLRGRHDPIKCHVLWGQRTGRPAVVKSKSRGETLVSGSSEHNDLVPGVPCTCKENWSLINDLSGAKLYYNEAKSIRTPSSPLHY